MIYEWMKNKILKRQYIKAKRNDEMLIVLNNNLEIYYLNTTAAYIFEAIDENKTLEDIKNEMLNVYDVSESELKEDLIEIIRDLQWKKIIVLEE